MLKMHHFYNCTVNIEQPRRIPTKTAKQFMKFWWEVNKTNTFFGLRLCAIRPETCIKTVNRVDLIVSCWL